MVFRHEQLYNYRKQEFKTSKENYAIGLANCYKFTKKKLNMELNMILIILLEHAYIRHSLTL